MPAPAPEPVDDGTGRASVVRCGTPAPESCQHGYHRSNGVRYDRCPACGRGWRSPTAPVPSPMPPCGWCGNTATTQKDGMWSCSRCEVSVGPSPAECPGTIGTPAGGRARWPGHCPGCRDAAALREMRCTHGELLVMDAEERATLIARAEAAEAALRLFLRWYDLPSEDSDDGEPFLGEAVDIARAALKVTTPPAGGEGGREDQRPAERLSHSSKAPPPRPAGGKCCISNSTVEAPGRFHVECHDHGVGRGRRGRPPRDKRKGVK